MVETKKAILVVNNLRWSKNLITCEKITSLFQDYYEESDKSDKGKWRNPSIQDIRDFFESVGSLESIRDAHLIGCIFVRDINLL